MKKIFTILGMVAVSAFANAQIVINEIYGGGGGSNSAILYKYDFVELKNIGTTTVTLTGAYLQYASAAGTFNGGSNTHVLPNITLAPGQTYLVQEGQNAGSVGADLPNPDTTGSINISATAGKLALTTDDVAPTAATGTNIIDFVGFGSTASYYEGSGAAAAPSNSTSTARISGDTNNNSVDFTVGTPTPQNSTSGTLAVSDISKTKSNFVKNTFVKNNEIIFGTDVKDVKVYTLTGQLVKTSSVKANEKLNIAELAEGNYIVTGTVNNEAVSQKILKN